MIRTNIARAQKNGAEAAPHIVAWHCRRAASLPEVIASVVATAVLMATVLPAVATVAREGKSGRCLSNLGRIAHATAIYSAMDPGQMALPVHPLQPEQDPFAPSFIGAYEWGGKSGIGRMNQPETMDVLDSRYGTLAGFGPASRPLNKIIFKEPFPDYTKLEDPVGAMEDTQLDLPIFRCPSDIGYTGVHFRMFRDDGYTSYDNFGTSYTANMFMIASGSGPMSSNSPYLHSVSQIRDPGTTLAYYENCGRFAWSAGAMHKDCQFIGPGVPGTVRGWHGADWIFNAAFVDGHVDSIYMRGFDNPDIGAYPSLNGQDADFRSLRCIIVRGDGWQKDTLPAPLIPTGLNAPGQSRPSWEVGIE